LGHYGLRYGRSHRSGCGWRGRYIRHVRNVAAAMKLLDCRNKHAGSIIASTIGEITSGSTGSQELACIPFFNRRVVTMTMMRRRRRKRKRRKIQQSTTLNLVSRVETRSTLRYLRALRISGSKRDVLVVVSDSGCFSILDFESTTNVSAPQILHCPTFGKEGIRRDTPEKYMTVDPRGRACMIASTEKRKLGGRSRLPVRWRRIDRVRLCLIW
jgi:hypothetical protein